MEGNTCWEAITEKEFRYWIVEVGKSHNVFSHEISNTKDLRYFIEDAGLNKIQILTKVKGYGRFYYYKNVNIIGGVDERRT